MARISAFTIAQKDIEARFQVENRAVFTYADIAEIFEEKRRDWRLPTSWSAGRFITELQEKTGKLQKHEVHFPNAAYVRYAWSHTPTDMELVFSLGADGFVSHYTAMSYHQLTEQEASRIYLTTERSKPATPPRRGTLTQDSIDVAFAKPQRVTTNVAPLPDGGSLVRLVGSHTRRFGVVRGGSSGLSVTGVERTLVDAAIRPLYSGGVDEVVEAYRRAGQFTGAEKVSVNKVVAYLKRLNPVYPYHQAIGFYMDRSGTFSASQVNRLREFDAEFDFYLTYAMAEAKYSPEWRLHYPSNID